MPKNDISIHTLYLDSCPWCSKPGIRTSAMGRTIMQVCANRCGYVVFIPKSQLSKKERIKYYTPNAYDKERKPTDTRRVKEKKFVAEKFSQCIRDNRRKCRKQKYSRDLKASAKNNWLRKKSCGTVFLPKDTAASGRSESSTSSLTQSNQ